MTLPYSVQESKSSPFIEIARWLGQNLSTCSTRNGAIWPQQSDLDSNLVFSLLFVVGRQQMEASTSFCRRAGAFSPEQNLRLMLYNSAFCSPLTPYTTAETAIAIPSMVTPTTELSLTPCPPLRYPQHLVLLRRLLKVPDKIANWTAGCFKSRTAAPVAEHQPNLLFATRRTWAGVADRRASFLQGVSCLKILACFCFGVGVGLEGIAVPFENEPCLGWHVSYHGCMLGSDERRILAALEDAGLTFLPIFLLTLV